MFELFQALNAKYPVARALQGLLTTYVGLIYYDIEFDTRFDRTVSITTTSFGWNLAPAKKYTIGYRAHQISTNVPPFLTAVLVIIALHHALVTLVVLRFSRETRLSRPGDPWQDVAHVVSGGETELVLAASGSANVDREVAKRRMKDAGLELVCVGVSQMGDHTVALTKRTGAIEPNNSRKAGDEPSNAA